MSSTTRETQIKFILAFSLILGYAGTLFWFSRCCTLLLPQTTLANPETNFADQITDIIFAGALIRSSEPSSTVSGLLALTFIAFSSLVAGCRAVGQGGGVTGFASAASRAHLVVGCADLAFTSQARLTVSGLSSVEPVAR